MTYLCSVSGFAASDNSLNKWPRYTERQPLRKNFKDILTELAGLVAQVLVRLLRGPPCLNMWWPIASGSSLGQKQLHAVIERFV